MLPKAYSYAGCGSCHTHLEVPNNDMMQRGSALFERYDCLACHRVDNRGGTLRPGGAGGLEGPNLTASGMRGYREDWYAQHLEQRAKPDAAPAWRTAFGEIPQPELDAIRVYLDSRVGAPGLLEGKALFHSLGCRGCHKIGGVGGDDGPDLTRVGQKDPVLTPFSNVKGPHTLDNWLKEHFRNPAEIVPGSAMPQLGLTEEQIEHLTFYMLSLRRGNFAESLWPRDRIRAERFGAREFATDGATIYGTFCASCHGPAGEGMRYPNMPPFPAIGNPDFLRLVDDKFIRDTVHSGRPGRRMPAWGEKEGGLRPEEVDAVVTYVRTMGGVEFEGDSRPPRWAKGDIANGKAAYVRACALCHGDNGEGKEGPALNNQVLLRSATDTYLYETIRVGRRNTTMGGFGEGSSVRQALMPQDMEAIVAFIRAWEQKK
jgi:cytochrome c oxidase cbb3-type subunit 3